MSKTREIYLTEQDMDRLQSLVEITGGRDRQAAEALLEELDRAIVVPQQEIPPDVVTMHSRIVVEDELTHVRRQLTLVYPNSSDPDTGKVSILAPVGTAVLGLTVGESIRWSLPDGRIACLRILSVVYQPEASGDYHL